MFFKAEKKEQESKKDNEKIEVDLSEMSEMEKLALLKKECPELLIYVEDYKRKDISEPKN